MSIPEQHFLYRSHVKSCMRFFILFMCSGMAAAAVFGHLVTPESARQPLISLVLPFLVSLIAGGLTWHAATLWTGQRITLGENELEYWIGNTSKIVPFGAVKSFTFFEVPLIGGHATLRTDAVSVRLYTNLEGITDLLRTVRERIDLAGLESTYHYHHYHSFCQTAAFCGQRAARYSTRYRWFPWLAVLAPVVVIAGNGLLPVSAGTRILWAALFALYPWVVIFIIETVFARKFLQGGTAPDRSEERRLIHRGTMLGYYGFLFLNLMVIVRLAM